ncbi:2-keto-4-pentenoate hydratase/2-oxohepta-3-ene-1,7-dioic acid hydratase in catechol pathway [Bradyrhizobium diazoefficiens]
MRSSSARKAGTSPRTARSTTSPAIPVTTKAASATGSRHTSQFLSGKTFAESGSFGPWLVTADEIPDPSKLTLQTRLNGTVVQDTTTDLLITAIPGLIAYISTICPLVPGDVIVTGTPGGVGAKRTPPLWMRPGDTVEVEISGIGTLRNKVIAEPE